MRLQFSTNFFVKIIISVSVECTRIPPKLSQLIPHISQIKRIISIISIDKIGCIVETIVC